MKLPVLVSGLFVLASVPTTAADLTLHVTNIDEPQGVLLWSLFDSQASYDADNSPLVSAKHRVDGGSLRITLGDLPAGRYAVKLYHDANGNGKLDTNALGIPREGYGFSNNGGRFGPPSFDDAAVPVDGDTDIEIRVR